MGSVWDLVDNCKKCSKEYIPEDDGMCGDCSPAAIKRNRRWVIEKEKELKMVRQFIKDNNIKWVFV